MKNLGESKVDMKKLVFWSRNHRTKPQIICLSVIHLPGSWIPFYVTIIANPHVFREVEIVLPCDGSCCDIHTFRPRYQKQKAPENFKE